MRPPHTRHQKKSHTHTRDYALLNWIDRLDLNMQILSEAVIFICANQNIQLYRIDGCLNNLITDLQTFRFCNQQRIGCFTMCLTNFQWKVLWNSLEIERSFLIQIDRHRSLCALFILSWRESLQKEFSLSIRTKGLPPISGDYVLFGFMWTSKRAHARAAYMAQTSVFNIVAKHFYWTCVPTSVTNVLIHFLPSLCTFALFSCRCCAFLCAFFIWFFLCQPTSPDILNPIEIHYFTRSTVKKITRWLN